MTRHRRRIRRTALFAALGCALSIGWAPSAGAGDQVGPTYAGGTLTCGAGESVWIESYAVGLITHQWNSDGGPNAEVESVEYFQPLFGVNYTDTNEQATVWKIYVEDQPGGQGIYGMGDNFNGAFCGE